MNGDVASWSLVCIVTEVILKERLEEAVFTCSALFFFLYFCFVLFLCPPSPSRTSRLPGAPGCQPGSHEEQERGQPGRHPPGYEALPVPAQLLRAGHHPGRLHPGRRPRPGASSFILLFPPMSHTSRFLEAQLHL